MEHLSKTFTLLETRPNGEGREVFVTFDLVQELFSYEDPKAEIIKKVQGQTCFASLRGSTEIDEKTKKKYRLSCRDIKMFRNYYLYLFGLPMKLKDPGTKLDSKLNELIFLGQEVYALKVTYASDVGKDTWYFYLDKKDYRLRGCRFYHDESKNDGEYIVFEGELTTGHMRLPQKRTWYVNKNDRLLGSDTLKAADSFR